MAVKAVRSNIVDKRGKGLKKQTFYSICSKHKHPKHFCDLCNMGHWINNIAYWFGFRKNKQTLEGRWEQCYTKNLMLSKWQIPAVTSQKELGEP